MPLRRGRRVAAAVATAAVVAACSPTAPSEDPTPTPTPSAAADDGPVEAEGDRVAVIVPPPATVAAAEGAALATAATELAEDPPPGVVEVRVSRATSAAFVEDLAHLAADDGFDLVCVVGTGTAELVLELARQDRDVRFCTTDGMIAGGPVNLTAVAVDPGALVEAGAVAVGTADAPVGLLLGATLGDSEALTEAFTSAVAPPRRPATPAPSPSGGTGTAASPSPTETPSPALPGPSTPQPPFVTATPGPGASAQLSAAEQIAAQQPSRALLLVTPNGTATAVAVGRAGTEIVAVSDWVVDPEGELPPNVLVALTVDWGALLAGAVTAGLADDAAQIELLGVADGVLGALPGQAAEAAAATERTAEHLRRSAE